MIALLFGQCALASAQQAAGAGPGHQVDEERPAPATAAAREIARTHFDAAIAHYRARRYREAIREFQLSLAAVSNADLWFDIGRAHEQLGELDQAVDAYRTYLSERVGASDADQVNARIAALESRIDAERGAATRAQPTTGALAVDASQAGARIRLDGHELGTAPIDRVIDLPVGSHRVDATLAGHAPFAAEIDVQPGAVNAAYVRLDSLRDTGAAPPRARVVTWILAGASGLALLTGGALGATAIAQRNAGHFDSGKSLQRGSALAFGVGFGLALGATFAYVLEQPEAGDALR